MGNSKDRRLAGQLLKSYGLPKRFAPKSKVLGWAARDIISFLSLKHGDLVYDKVTEENHKAVGFLVDLNDGLTTVLHLVYDDHSVGSDAFGCTPPREDAKLHLISNKQSPMLDSLHEYEFASLVQLKRR